MNPEVGQPPLPAVLVVPLLAGTTAVLHVAGSTPLLPAPVTSFGAWTGWIGSTAPLEVAFGVVRLLAVATCYHLLAVQLVASVARVVGRPRLAHIAERLTPTPLRAHVRRLAGVGLTAVTALAAPAPAGGAGDPTGRAVVQVVPDSNGTASVTALPPSHDTDPLDDTSTAPPATAVVEVVDGGAAPTVEDRRHRVRPGDHLWAIAADELSSRSAQAPDDAAVERYWRRVVLANPQLEDPDLVFAGDVITLPPVSHTG